MASTASAWSYTQPRGHMTEFEEYLKERSEGKADLKKMYQDLNKKYFGGSLPNIPVKWSGKLKNAVGIAKVSYSGGKVKKPRFHSLLPEIPVANVEIDISSLKINISTMFTLLVKDIKAVLLHEMVHIKLYTQRKIGGHHGSPEFDGWINKLRAESGLDVKHLESQYKASKHTKAKEGFLLVIHMTDGRKGITTYTTKFMKEKWLIFAKTIASFAGRSAKMNKVDFYKITHKIITEIPAKRSLRSLGWDIVDEELIKDIERKGKQWGYADRQGARLSPYSVGIRDKDMLNIPVDIDNKGNVTNLKEILRSRR